MNEQLRALAFEVQKYRVSSLTAKTALGICQDNFNAEFAPLIAHVKETNAALQGAEADLRKATVAAYLADPAHNKNVLPGVVAIRDNTVVGYDLVKALAWAKEHGICLLLDGKVYEEFVRAGHAPGTVVVEPQATIAREIKLPEVKP